MRIFLYLCTYMSTWKTMKIRVIKEDSIWDYCIRNASAAPSFHIFLERLKICDWNDLNEIKANFQA